MSEFFFNLGRQLGRKAVPAIRKSKWIWDGLAGSDEEALRAEAALGQSLATEVRQTTEPNDESSLAALLNDLCQRLSACVRDKGRTFRCEVIRDESASALALPGGFIFLSSALVGFCERRPDELAFVIGHEMAHVIRKHTWDRMVKEAALSVASVVTARAGAVGTWFRQKGMGLLRTAYSADNEFEADELGLRLVAAAGFAPGGAIGFLQRIERLNPTQAQPGQYFSSHPPARERATRLARLVKDAG